MDAIQEVLGGLNAILVISIAGGLALIFILVLAYDTRRRKRLRRAQARVPAGAVRRSSRRSGWLNRVKQAGEIYTAFQEEIEKREKPRRRGRRRSE